MNGVFCYRGKVMYLFLSRKSFKSSQCVTMVGLVNIAYEKS